MKNFMVCSNCGYSWKKREDFFNDKGVTIIGYQVNFEQLKAGFFLFNHICGTTFTLDVQSFEDLYNGPIFMDKEAGSDQCPGHCLHKSNLDPCPVKCECAFVREIIQILKK